MLVHDILNRNAAFFADAPAVIIPDTHSLTWRELQTRVHRWANALLGLGLHRGDRVAIYAPNCSEYVEFYFACATSGLVGAPLNIRLAPAELIEYVAYLKPHALLVHPSLLSSMAEWLPRAAPDASLVLLGGVEAAETPERSLEYLIADAPDLPPAVHTAADDVYQLAATSGTTGPLKAAMMTHRNAIAAMVNWLCEMPVAEKDVALQCIPQFFNPGGPAHLHPVMMKGGCVVIPPSFSPADFLTLASRYRVTHAVLVPTMLQMILAEAEAQNLRLDHIKGINTGGSPLPVDLLQRGRRTFGEVFYPIYGMAETFSCATMLRPEMLAGVEPTEQAKRLASVGRPMVLTDLRVVDAEGAEVAPDGQSPGEIWLAGDTVSAGYWQRADEEQSRDRGWFKTGDVAVVDEDQLVTIVDRSKDVIITGGINVFSREVEQTLLTHPCVAQVAVIGLPHPRWGEAIHAIVVPKPGMTPEADDLIAHVGRHLAGYKKPQSVEFVNALPVGSTGKVLKRRLREERVRPSSPTEESSRAHPDESARSTA